MFLLTFETSQIQSMKADLYHCLIFPVLYANRLFIASITFAQSGRKQYQTDQRNKNAKEKNRHLPACGKTLLTLLQTMLIEPNYEPIMKKKSVSSCPPSLSP